ncbi:MAG: hypothetical protein HC927_11240 [Deltaproteobacteria bacterium]|nr:hypothetical protein [Deltaproteobacteria bacterium]
MTRPGFGGRPDLRCQYWPLVSHLDSVLTIPDSPSNSWMITASPADGTAGVSCQVRVNAHHAVSSRKDFPKPLSPVSKLSRSATGSRARSSAGPTLWSTSLRSIEVFPREGSPCLDRFTASRLLAALAHDAAPVVSQSAS